MDINKTITLRPVDICWDFAQLAALFTLEDEPVSGPALNENYQVEYSVISLKVAKDGKGELMRFNWAPRNRFKESDTYLHIIAKPEHRRQGAGMRLFEDL